MVIDASGRKESTILVREGDEQQAISPIEFTGPIAL